MKLHFVMLPNPYVKKGRWVEEFDDGFQEAVVGTSPKGRMEVLRHKGLLLPKSILRPFLIEARMGAPDMAWKRT